MTDTRPVTIDLDAGTAAFIEREVGAGRSESLEAYVKTAVERTIVLDLFDEPDEASPEFQAFLAECEETGRRIDAGLEPTYTVQEVRARFEARRAELLGASQPHAAE